MPDIEDYLTINDVATRLRIGVRTVHRLIAESGLPVVRLGRSVRIPRARFEAWLYDRT
jgi:excisionase family DNA binding protein